MVSEEFVIVEATRVPQDLPQKFRDALAALDTEANDLARRQLDLEPGGLLPAGNQFGKTPIRLNYFNLGTTSGTAETWNRAFANRGWNTFINNDTLDDTVLAIAGLQLPNVSQRIAAHQWSIAGKDQPVIEHETEIMGFENPVIIYERGQLIPKKTLTKLDLLIQGAGGNHMVKPYGWALVSPEILTKKVPK
jgi:hypothetical protein